MKVGFLTRLALVEAALHPEAQWWKSDGLCALLQYAAQLPACAPEDIPGVDEGAPGLGGLLWAARQAAQEQADDA